MSQWKNDDSAANSVLWGVVGYNKTGNSANRDAFFGNTTVDGLVTGLIVGQFGVDPAEAHSSNGTINSVVFTSRGSGYSANATITVSGGSGYTTAAAANASSNSIGRISAVNFTNNGVNYTSVPTLTISAPTAQTFVGNATSVTVGNTTNTGWISLGTNRLFFVNNDVVTYLVGAGNTAIGGLTNNVSYYVTTPNSSIIQLSATSGGAQINLSSVTATAQPGHSITGQTATASAVLSSGLPITHAGWVIRKVGTGGRAGRVQFETLVAMGSMTGDASDDAILKDA